MASERTSPRTPARPGVAATAASRCVGSFVTEGPYDAAMTDDVDLALPRPAAPSPTQSHGTVMAALLSGFVVLAVLLWLSVRGVGPFHAQVLSTQPAKDGVSLTIQVTNDGRKAGHGKCHVERLAETGDRQGDFQFLSSRVPPHGSVTDTVLVPLGAGQHPGQVGC
jgi:hypothetical protein